MKARQLEKLGFPHFLAKPAKWAASAARGDGKSLQETREALAGIAADPDLYLEDPHYGELAQQMSLHLRHAAASSVPWRERDEPAPFQEWGSDLDIKAVKQVAEACRLPVATRAALMPDAHLGYGLPIGGVLACDNAVIPYAVGVDIACRVKLSVLDLPATALSGQRERLKNAIEHETRFGIGAEFRGRRNPHGERREHAVMDADWSVTSITAGLKDKAWNQLGTSGSGNHFVEFGTLTVTQARAEILGLDVALGAAVEPGPPSAATASEAETETEPQFVFLALLSHSGSRGAGAAICEHFSLLASQLHPNLPKPLKHLAWLPMDSPEGQGYWAAMNLMGDYAAANHACIHDAIARNLGARVMTDVENHHNFAWKETHDGQEMIVHRKGATPAGQGVLGIIPGSMAAPGYVVRGLGSEPSLRSASHGAGRVMSRRKAKETFRWAQVRPKLEAAGVELLSAGLDENPFVYKDIDAVMADQADLVERLARFDPKLVKMAPDGERAED